MKKILILITVLVIAIGCCNNTKKSKGKYAVYVPKHDYVHTYYTDEITFHGNSITFKAFNDSVERTIEGNYTFEILE